MQICHQYGLIDAVQGFMLICWAIVTLCQRLSLTQSMGNKPQARSASIERRRRESPPEAKDEQVSLSPEAQEASSSGGR